MRMGFPIAGDAFRSLRVPFVTVQQVFAAAHCTAAHQNVGIAALQLGHSIRNFPDRLPVGAAIFASQHRRAKFDHQNRLLHGSNVNQEKNATLSCPLIL